MLGKAFYIIQSKSIYSNALMANINAFYGALLTEKKLGNTEKDLKDTKITLKNQTDEIESLKKTCDDLDKKITALTERTKLLYIENNNKIRDYDPSEEKEALIKMRRMSSL